MMPSLRAGLLVVVGEAIAAAAGAQPTMDQVPAQRTITTKEAIDADLQNARILLGPMRVFPMVVIDQAGYDDNVFSRAEGEPKVGDYTFTAGAGGRILVPLGTKFYLRAMAVPQYIWYDKLVERRTWGGDYSGSFLALGNRLSLEADGSFSKGSVILNSETQTTVIESRADGVGKIEVALTRALSFVGSAEIERIRDSSEGQDPENPIEVQQFDRTDLGALAGLRLRLTSSLELNAGVQGTRSEFVLNPELRDNQTYAILGGLHFDRPRYFVNLAGGYRKGEAFNGSSFPRYNATVGSYYVSWSVWGPIELQGFGHRRPVYSRIEADQLYIETRNGGAVGLRIGPNVGIRAYAETGTNIYPFSVSEAGPRRTDDVTSYGAGLSVRLLGKMVVRVDATANELRPAAGGVERKILRVLTGLSFNGELSR
jgi:hypothetical protein